MNILGKIATSEIVAKVADEGIMAVKEVAGKFIGNYIKRRNVGFDVCRSLSGSWTETGQYYKDVFTGKDPTESKEAIYFDKK